MRQQMSSTACSAALGLQVSADRGRRNDDRVEQRHDEPARPGDRHHLPRARQQLLLCRSGAGQSAGAARGDLRWNAGQPGLLQSDFDHAHLSRLRGPARFCFAIGHPVHPRPDRRLAQQPQRVAAGFGDPGQYDVLDPQRATKALQASLAVNGSGAQQSSVLVVLVGNVFGSTGSLQGVIHGSYLANGTSQPVRINSYYQPPVDGTGNSFYGKSGISGFALAPGAGAANAVEVNTANQTTTANYQFVQPAIPTACRRRRTAPRHDDANLVRLFRRGHDQGADRRRRHPAALCGDRHHVDLDQRQQSAAVRDLDRRRSVHLEDQRDPALRTGSCCSTARPTGARARAKPLSTTICSRRWRARPALVVGRRRAASSSNSFPTTNPNIYLVTQTAAPAPASLLPNGLCSSCQYLQWGYWGGELDTPAREIARRGPMSGTSTSGWRGRR